MEDFCNIDFSAHKKLRQIVFTRMLIDEYSDAAKNDKLICDFGARYLKKNMGTTLTKSRNTINVTSRKMRELGKVLVLVSV